MKSTSQIKALGSGHFVVKPLALAVFAVFTAPLSALAGDDPTVAELINPSSSIEVGVISTNKDSAKFGEYNGLDQKGLHGNVNVDINKREDNGTGWYSINGTNLGLDNRNLKAEGGYQGNVKFSLEYDSLERNQSDTNKTIWSNPGSSNLTLPATFKGLQSLYADPNGAFALAASTGINTYNAYTAANTTSTAGGYPAATYGAAGASRLITWYPSGTSTLLPGATLSGGRRNTVNMNPYWGQPFAAGALNTALGGLSPVAYREAVLAPFLHSFDLSTQREKYELGVNKDFYKDWDLGIKFGEERKTGNKITMAYTNGMGIPVIEPVDYTTRNLDATVNFRGEQYQLQFGYTLSVFEDDTYGVRFQSPSAMSTTTATTNTVSGARLMDIVNFGINSPQGLIATPPDNKAYQFFLTGGYNFGKDTRLTINWSTGHMKQDEQFQALSATPLKITAVGATCADASSRACLPFQSLDGDIKTTLVNVGLTSRVTKDLTLNAKYRYDDRDYSSNVGTYWRSVRDSGAGGAFTVSMPGYTQTKYSLDADYRLTTDTKLKAGVEREDVETTETFATGVTDKQKTKEDTYRLGFNTHFTDQLSLDVKATQGTRDGITPLDNANAEALDAFYKWFYADRQRTTVHAGLDYAVNDNVNIGLSADDRKDSFDNSNYGLQSNKMQSYTLDTSFTLAEDTTLSMFYTWDTLKLDQKDCLNNAGVCRVNTHWTVQQKDVNDTIGASFVKKGLLGGKLNLSADASYTKGTTSFHETSEGMTAPSSTTGSPASNTIFAASPLPDITSRLTVLKLSGEYKLSKEDSVKLAVMAQKLKTTDFTYAGGLVAAAGAIIMTGQQAPNYSATAAYLSWIHKF